MSGRETGEWKEGKEQAGVGLGHVFDFVKESVINPAGRMRQAEVLVDGLAVGGVKEASNQIFNHTGETAWKAVGSTLTGVGFGVVLGASNKLLKAGAGAVSSLMLLGGIGHEVGSIVNDKKLAGALDAVWKNGDAETLRKAKQIGEAELGGEGFGIGLGVICGTAGGGAAGFLTNKWEAASVAAKAAKCEGDTCEISWHPGTRPVKALGGSGAGEDQGSTIRTGADLLKLVSGETQQGWSEMALGKYLSHPPVRKPGLNLNAAEVGESDPHMNGKVPDFYTVKSLREWANGIIPEERAARQEHWDDVAGIAWCDAGKAAFDQGAGELAAMKAEVDAHLQPWQTGRGQAAYRAHTYGDDWLAHGIAENLSVIYGRMTAGERAGISFRTVVGSDGGKRYAFDLVGDERMRVPVGMELLRRLREQTSYAEYRKGGLPDLTAKDTRTINKIIGDRWEIG